MKRISIALAVIAAFGLASCVREVPENGSVIEIGENTLAFKTGEAAKTRAAEAAAPVSVETIKLGEPVDGEQFYLEEIVTTLDDVYAEAPATRGTPAYTSNIGALYGSFNALAFPTSSTVASSDGSDAAMKDGVFNFVGSNIWTRKFEKNPLDTDPSLYFFMRMPGSQPGVDSVRYHLTGGEGTISFRYESPDSARLQQDILFSGRALTKADFTPAAPVLFQHALTGIKFATANHISGLNTVGTSTFITKVEFEGLYGKGTCVFTPQKENGGYTDLAGTYSSKNAVKWSDTTVIANKVYSQEFTEENFAANVYASHYDYDNGGQNDGYFPDSFYATDNVNSNLGEHRSTFWNINDENASLTFWFIPQVVNANVKMRVTFYIQAGTRKGQEITREINFGETLAQKSVEWKAGEIRTYVLKANEVAVTVEDEMINENTKQMVQIRNTGNVPEWVRATVTANWCVYQDADGNIIDPTEVGIDSLSTLENVAVYGYTSADASVNQYVAPWDFEVEAATGSTPSYEAPMAGKKYGTFTHASFNADGTVNTASIASGIATSDLGWVKGIDGYYYYNRYIGVDQAATTPLFYQYTVITDNVPRVFLLDKALQRYEVKVHLVMDVVVQAILADETEVQNPGPNVERCNAAWQTALGYAPIQ